MPNVNGIPGVVLIDRQGEEVHPVHHVQRVPRG